MKKQIMCVVFLFLLLGCSREEGVTLEPETSGFLVFTGGLISDLTDFSAKYETPECSENPPVSIRYILTDAKDSVIIAESPIVLEGDKVTSTNRISVTEGKYTVADIALLSSDGTVVQRIPSKLTTGFDFTSFVAISTPFDVTVLGGEETILTGDMLCYSVQKGDFESSVGGIFHIKELQTMYIRITENNTVCADRIVVEIEGRVTDEILIESPGLYNTPVPAGLFGMVIRLFSGSDQILSRTLINAYNPDGVLDAEDIIKFNIDCDEPEPEPVELFDYRNGGIVFWIDPMDSSHGLVCAISDQGQVPWGCEGVEVMAPDQDPNSLNHNGTSVSLGSGEANTSNILFTCSEPGIAARLSADYSITIDEVVYDDWFLPSRDALNQMYLNKAAIDAIALANGGTIFSTDSYWSSSHVKNDFLLIAWYKAFGDDPANETNGALKSLKFNVRSIRAF